jgi:hypothetical protein
MRIKNGSPFPILQTSLSRSQHQDLSNIDTFGCLYRGNYNPSDSSNQIACNDDYINNQFRLSSFLEVGVPYTLLFTTYRPDVTGSYSVVAYGPGEMEFNPVDTVQITTTDFYTTFTSTMTPTQSFVLSNYSSELTNSSEMYSGSNKYYEAIQIMVYTTGYYTLNSVENIDGMGYLYRSYFDPLNPSYNLLAEDDQNGGNNQFSIQAYLQAGLSYTLVFTTYQQNITGLFSIVASGPNEVEFSSVDTFQTSTSTPIYETSDYSYEATSNYSDGIISKYSSALTLGSGTFSRAGGSGSNYYYEAIQINVNTTGIYTFISQSNTRESNMDTTDTSTFVSQGYMDTYGYIYQDSFYPSNPAVNSLQQDDDNAGHLQFRLTVSCRADITYVLVFTTFSGGVTGPFSIMASGPDNVIFNSIDNAATIMY